MTEQLSLLDLLKSAPPKVELTELWTADDIFGALDANILGKFGEDFRVERKSARKDPRDLGDDLSAFANSQPQGGILIIGVENDGKVTGFSGFGPDRPSEFEEIVRYCPDARVTTRRVGITNVKGNADFIIAIRVFYRPDRVVETPKGDAFIRSGKTKRRLTEPEKREIRISRGEIEYEREPVDLKYPDDFDTLLIREFCESFIEKRNLKPGHSPEDILALKCAHEGARRIRDAMKESDLPPPEFSQKQIGHHQVHVSLRNSVEARKTFVDADAARVLGEKLFAALEDRERMIVNYIARHKSINVSDANRLLQCDWRTAKNILERLCTKKILQRRTATGRDRDPKAAYEFRRRVGD